ncbi:MAG: sarcosine oxidase subunit gamma family protein [Casimicrobiaceae bacterium]
MSESGSDGIGSTTAGHYGAQGTGVALSTVAIAAAWNIQGDAARPSFVTDIEQQFGIALPLVPNTAVSSDALIAMWLGPRSWLLVESSPPARALAQRDFDSRRDAVNALGGALFDVSASRVGYQIRGTQAETILAKSCPLDFGVEAFAVGACAQSVFGHVNALFYREDYSASFVMLVARSFAADVWRTLCQSSAQYGYTVEAPLDS